jgi:hypothetical protein
MPLLAARLLWDEGAGNREGLRWLAGLVVLVWVAVALGKLAARLEAKHDDLLGVDTNHLPAGGDELDLSVSNNSKRTANLRQKKGQWAYLALLVDVQDHGSAVGEVELNVVQVGTAVATDAPWLRAPGGVKCSLAA